MCLEKGDLRLGWLLAFISMLPTASLIFFLLCVIVLSPLGPFLPKMVGRGELLIV